MRVLDLFSGIGGFSLGLERAGMETVAFCEIEPYCRKVLNKHWPDVPIYEDVHDVSKSRLESDGIRGIDVITGGFPCQDISVAGKQAGIEGERSGLWGELCRIIGDIRPQYAIVENVTALISGDRGRWFGRVLGDLAEIGFDAEWHCIPASELGAHHHRDRVWIVAYPNQKEPRGLSVRKAKEHACVIGGGKEVADTRCELRESRGTAELETDKGQRASSGLFDKSGCAGQSISISYPISQRGRSGNTEREDAKNVRQLLRSTEFREWDTEPNVGRVANGIPRRSHRLRGLGNAVVPQIPELIGRAIMESEGHVV